MSPSELLLLGPTNARLRLGLLAPLSGVMGVTGPSIINCSILAAEEIAAATGALVDLVLIDAGRAPLEVAGEVDQLVSAGLIRGLVGTHTSNVRVVVDAVLGDRVPYIFTPPHESSRGQQSTGSIFLGSGPLRQIRSPLTWIAENRHVRRWALIGNDYVWPREVHTQARRVLRELGQSIVFDRLVPLGAADADELIDGVIAHGADAVLVSLVGRDGIAFHRAVADRGAGHLFVRLCTALDENCLIAVGGDVSGDLYSALPSFLLQGDDRHQRLLEAYIARFGLVAPLPSTYAEGTYDGTHLLASMCLSGLLARRSPVQAAAELQRPSAERRHPKLAQANAHELHLV